MRLTSLDILCELSLLEGELKDFTVTAHVFQSVLQLVADVQERIVFQCQNVMREEIIGFTPSEAVFKALTCPDKFEGNSSPKKATFYPTLDACLSTLAKVFHCVEIKVFEGLARELVSSCTSSLLYMHKIMKSSNALHADLCLIAHLLLLREQISPFPIDFSITEKTLDFSHMRDMFSMAIRGKLSFSMIAVESAPRVLENQVDFKKDLENELKNACERVISFQTNKLLGDGLLVAFLGVARSNSSEVQQEDEFQVINLLNTLSSFGAHAKEFSQKLNFYLSNPATEAILLRPIKMNCRDSFYQLSIFLESFFPTRADLRKLIPEFDSSFGCSA